MHGNVLFKYLSGTSADWWSVGVILFELIVGIPPFIAEHPQVGLGSYFHFFVCCCNLTFSSLFFQMIFDNILNRNIPWPAVPDEMSPDAQDLIHQ